MEPESPSDGPPGLEDQLDGFQRFMVEGGLDVSTAERYMGIVRKDQQGEALDMGEEKTHAAVGWWTRFQKNRWAALDLARGRWSHVHPILTARMLRPFADWCWSSPWNSCTACSLSRSVRG